MDAKRPAVKPRRMQWSTAKPVREGYYWYREKGIEDVVRVYNRLRNGSLVATGAFYEQSVVKRMDGLWAGPIPRPVE